MKFCLLVTVALDIFKKETNNALCLPWISPFSFFLCKGCLLGQTKRRCTLLTIFRPPPPAYYILHKFPTPYLLEPLLSVYSGP